MTIAHIFLILGSFLLLAGLVFLAFGRGEGGVTGRWGDKEISIATPPLIVLLIGAAFVMFPFSPYGAKAWQKVDQTEATVKTDTPAVQPKVEPGPTPVSTPAVEKRTIPDDPVDAAKLAREEPAARVRRRQSGPDSTPAEQPEADTVEEPDAKRSVSKRTPRDPAATEAATLESLAPKSGRDRDWRVKIAVCKLPATDEESRVADYVARDLDFNTYPVTSFVGAQADSVVYYYDENDRPAAESLARLLRIKFMLLFKVGKIGSNSSNGLPTSKSFVITLVTGRC